MGPKEWDTTITFTFTLQEKKPKVCFIFLGDDVRSLINITAFKIKNNYCNFRF